MSAGRVRGARRRRAERAWRVCECVGRARVRARDPRPTALVTRKRRDHEEKTCVRVQRPDATRAQSSALSSLQSLASNQIDLVSLRVPISSSTSANQMSRSTRIYVGNLPRDARLYELEDRFSRYGESRRARARAEPLAPSLARSFAPPASLAHCRPSPPPFPARRPHRARRRRPQARLRLRDLRGRPRRGGRRARHARPRLPRPPLQVRAGEGAARRARPPDGRAPRPPRPARGARARHGPAARRHLAGPQGPRPRRRQRALRRRDDQRAARHLRRERRSARARARTRSALRTRARTYALCRVGALTLLAAPLRFRRSSSSRRRTSRRRP